MKRKENQTLNADIILVGALVLVRHPMAYSQDNTIIIHLMPSSSSNFTRTPFTVVGTTRARQHFRDDCLAIHSTMIP